MPEFDAQRDHARTPAASGHVVVEFDQIRAAMLQALIDEVAAMAEELGGALGRLGPSALQQLGSADRSAIRHATQSTNQMLARLEMARSLGTIDRLLRAAQSPAGDADGLRSA
jgi:hypothetical protein